MRITLLTVGKLKEKYWKDAIDEYVKRLGRYAKVDIVEVADEKTPDNASEAEEEQIRRIEGARLIEEILQGSYVITLEILGKMLDSVQLSETISDWMVKGESHLCFIIGGSLGLSKEVSARASYKLSFSKMTFPHQLMRVILLEQLYRAFRIQKGEPYHK